ncbi:hypothetical protein M878_10855 [Streptomyces roseochromogenus subsp. oscitans DS 12.976]|uniref:Uncharacterized protein n=1 Tax=Streptomyces roseochromogenus subsp. oscitans DS 12.976 TaxID=1352936 RepID=V6KQ79_STRRC|nr:hypothetical protein M878_10855 [Streptomyces roseochromogenus subsp. oscitans DS 12.976]
MKVRQTSPVTTSPVPAVVNGHGPNVGRKRWDRPAPTAIATATGRKARLALIKEPRVRPSRQSSSEARMNP